MVMLSTEPLHQVAALKLSVNSLQATTRDLGVTYHLKEELDELATTLGLFERHLECQKSTDPEVLKKLERYQSLLVDLSRLQKITNAADSEEIIEDVRALLLDVVHKIGLMNAHMIVTAQKSTNIILRDYIIAVAIRRRDPDVLSSVLNAMTPFERTKSWNHLQQELQDFGLSREQSNEEHDFILQTVRMAANESRLLGEIVAKPNLDDIPDCPSPTTFTNSSSGDLSSERTPSMCSRSSASSKFSFDSDMSLESEIVRPVAVVDFRTPISVDVKRKSRVDQGLKLQTHWFDDYFADPQDNMDLALDTYSIASTVPPSHFTEEPDMITPIAPVASTSNLAPQIEAPKLRRRSASEGHDVSIEPEISLAPRVVTEVTATETEKTKALKSKKPGLMSRMKFKMTNNKDEFCELVKTGDIEHIKGMIDRGASANTENSLGRTALIIAAANGHYDVTKLLLKNGARPDTVAEGGDTALSMAVLREYDDIAEMLLQHGANPNAAANYGTTALAQAAVTDNVTLVQLLLDYGAEVNCCNASGETALAYAAGKDHIETALLLLSNGASVDKVFHGGQTPLLKAVENGSVDMVELLIKHGADPQKTSRNQTPLKFAIRECKNDILDVFILYGFYNTGYRKKPSRRQSRVGASSRAGASSVRASSAMGRSGATSAMGSTTSVVEKLSILG